ncbi:MAG: hypothetical protein ACRD2W_04125 [Acidimicrobiales bacterium]
MSTTDIESKFNAADDEVQVEVAPPPANLMGTWVADDPATRGIVKVVLANAGGTLTVHAFGACTPSPCDWGKVKGRTYGPDVSTPRAVAFTSNYSFGFKTTILAGHLSKGRLIVDSFNTFAAGDSRSDYYSSGSFHRV